MERGGRGGGGGRGGRGEGEGGEGGREGGVGRGREGGREEVAVGRVASVVILILGIASLFDYPLRTPAMAGFAGLVLVWFAHARQAVEVG